MTPMIGVSSPRRLPLETMTSFQARPGRKFASDRASTGKAQPIIILKIGKWVQMNFS